MRKALMFHEKLTYANVMSTIAVFLLLGGGAAFAASHLPKNSVGAKQLKKNAVTTSEIKKNAVTTVKIRNRAVTGQKIDLSSLGTVPSAVDAQTLDGQTAAQISEAAKVRCPAGTIATAGVCFESAERTPPASLAEAAVQCAKSNRRLPSMGELITFDIQNFSEPPNPEWVDSLFQNGAQAEANVVLAWAPNNLTVVAQAASGNHRYRCVAEASN